MEPREMSEIKTIYQLYIHGVIHMCFDNENAILRFVNRMHKVGMFTEIAIYKITIRTTTERFTADYL